MWRRYRDLQARHRINFRCIQRLCCCDAMLKTSISSTTRQRLAPSPPFGHDLGSFCGTAAVPFDESAPFPLRSQLTKDRQDHDGFPDMKRVEHSYFRLGDFDSKRTAEIR